MDMETIREMFGYCIFECYKNKEIQKYLEHKCNRGKYANFKRVANVIIDNPRSKLAGKAEKPIKKPSTMSSITE
jgi:hypothetical protein